MARPCAPASPLPGPPGDTHREHPAPRAPSPRPTLATPDPEAGWGLVRQGAACADPAAPSRPVPELMEPECPVDAGCPRGSSAILAGAAWLPRVWLAGGRRLGCPQTPRRASRRALRARPRGLWACAHEALCPEPASPGGPRGPRSSSLQSQAQPPGTPHLPRGIASYGRRGHRLPGAHQLGSQPQPLQAG